MRKTTILALIGLGVLAILGTSRESALGAGADGEAPEAAQTCRKAEVNPVTGHVFCFDPIGAPVAAPPPAAEVPCKAEAHTGEAWSWSPKCKPEDAGKPAPGAEG